MCLHVNKNSHWQRFRINRYLKTLSFYVERYQHMQDRELLCVIWFECIFSHKSQVLAMMCQTYVKFYLHWFMVATISIKPSGRQHPGEFALNSKPLIYRYKAGLPQI